MPTNPNNASNATRKDAGRREHDRRRGSACKRGYGRDHQAWREQVLARDPLCVFCKAGGRYEAASVADHITPIVIDASRRLDLDNGRGVCEPCHRKLTDNFKATGINEMPITTKDR